MSDEPAGPVGADSAGVRTDGAGGLVAGRTGTDSRGRHAAAQDLAETLILPAQRWSGEDEPELVEQVRRQAGRHASQPPGEPGRATATAAAGGVVPGDRVPRDLAAGDLAAGLDPAAAWAGTVASDSASGGEQNGRRPARPAGSPSASRIPAGRAPAGPVLGRPAGLGAGFASVAGRPPAEQPAGPALAASRDSRLRLVWVYPDLLSTYGDRGNALILSRRARLRGIEVELIEVNSDQPVPADGDIYLLGGGEDLPQILAASRLRADGGLATAASRGATVFAVCAGYQVLGHTFGGVEGEPVDGLGILDISSGRGDRRGVGELVADVDPALSVPRLTGFENHQGVTHLGPGARPLARVSLGVGNGDGTEGAYAGKVLGTYLHGPALARNPGLADLLLSWVAGPLPPLDPEAEEWASQLRAERLAAVAQ